MTKQEFIEWAKSKGWKQDTWGHLKKDTHRFKIQKTSVRYERKGFDRWYRIRSGYYKNLSITEDNKIKGLK